jgi:uncharacterized NAD(P)/FAD-binding protein YdhS
MSASMHVAIVGGGAASVAFLTHLVESLDAEMAKAVRVTVIESGDAVGPGLAYQEDCASLVLNRIAATMSVNADKFSMFAAWMKWKSCYRHDMEGFVTGNFPEDYVPRAFFGRYLRDCFDELRHVAADKGLEVAVLQDRVQTIKKDTCYRLAMREGVLSADAVVLCTGHTQLRDHYGMSGHSRYVHQVYPLAKHLDALKVNQRICILGASLTAVDIAVSLDAVGYEGRIDMLSVRGLLPYVRGKDFNPYTLKHLTPQALQALIVKEGGALSLRQILRLFRRELLDNGCHWQSLLDPAWDSNAEAFLDREIDAARERRNWQLVLPAGNPLLHDLWNALRETDKDLFMRRFSRAWMACRTPIPMKNALTLQKMMKAGRLRVFGGPASFNVDTQTQFTMQHARQGSERYDWVLNATGSSPEISSERDSPLIWGLIQAGLAAPEPRGGIRLDFDSGSVLDATGAADPLLRATGHVTSGAYFYVDSLDMISRQSKRIAADLCRHLASRRSAETRRPPSHAVTAVTPG